MKIRSHRELEVYMLSFQTAMVIFELTKKFPKEETYSLTDQIRRSTRSVCANLAESFRKRRYPKSFVSKLSDRPLVTTSLRHFFNKVLKYSTVFASPVSASTFGDQPNSFFAREISGLRCFGSS